MVVGRWDYRKVVWMMLGLILWEGTVRSGRVNELIMPSFASILEVTFTGVADGTLLLQLGQSILYVFFGLVLGLTIAFIMACVGYYYQWPASLFDLLGALFHPLPGVALLPIIILWFGIGPSAVFAVILHAVVWSQYLTIKDGFKAVDPSYIEAAGNNGAGKIQLIRHVLIPMSMNGILLSLQVGWSRGWRALISAEMIFGAISSVGGIGWYMYERRVFMDTAGMFSGILLVMLVGIIVEQWLFSRWFQRLYDIQ